MEAAVTSRRTMTRVTTRTRIMMRTMMRIVLLPVMRSMMRMKIMTRTMMRMRTIMTSLTPGMKRKKMKRKMNMGAVDTTVAVRAEAAQTGVHPVGAEGLPAVVEAHPAVASPGVALRIVVALPGAVTGGALPPWTATRYGALPAKAAGPIMKKEGPMDMMKAGAVRAEALPVAAAIGIITTAVPPGAALRIAGALPATVIRPGIPRDISPAAADAPVTAAVQAAAGTLAAVDVPAAAVDAPVAAAAAPAEGRSGARFFHTYRQIEPVKTLFVCFSNINKSTLP